jgi:hypothetical protein
MQGTESHSTLLTLIIIIIISIIIIVVVVVVVVVVIIIIIIIIINRSRVLNADWHKNSLQVDVPNIRLKNVNYSHHENMHGM